MIIQKINETPKMPYWIPSDDKIARFYGNSVFSKKYKICLTKYICALLPEIGQLSILDVGAGDGLMGAFIKKYRPSIEVVGIETLMRIKNAPIQLIEYDGKNFPFESNSFDVVIFSNVIHHTKNQCDLMREAIRVGRKKILIKDHLYKSELEFKKLLLLDVLGNLRFGVSTSGDYLDSKKWNELFSKNQIDFVKSYNGIPMRTGVMKSIFSNQLEVIFDVDI